MRRKKRGQSRRRRVTPRRQRDVLRAAECGSWLTLKELSRLTSYGEASISAQLRHLRKPEYGAFVVEKRCREEGDPRRVAGQGPVWEYQLRRGRRKGTSLPWLTPTVLRGVIRAAKQVCEHGRAGL